MVKKFFNKRYTWWAILGIVIFIYSWARVFSIEVEDADDKRFKSKLIVATLLIFSILLYQLFRRKK